MSQAFERQPQTGGAEVTETPDHRAESLARDDAFEVLSNRRRRFTIHYLQWIDDAPLGDVSEQVAAWENDKRIEEVTPNERKCVYTSLQQFHLPKMEEKGVIEFDRQTNTLELTESAEDLDVYLEVVDSYEMPWSHYYLGLSLLGATCIGLAWLGVAPFAVVPFVGWVAALIVAMLVSSAAHLLLSRRMHYDGDQPPEVRL